MSRTRIEVPPDAAGSRIDAFLASAVPGLSRAAGTTPSGCGFVLAGAEPVKKNFRLSGGEALDVELPEARAVPSRRNRYRLILFMRTATSLWSTSRAALWCTLRPDMKTARWSTPCWRIAETVFRALAAKNARGLCTGLQQGYVGPAHYSQKRPCASELVRAAQNAHAVARLRRRCHWRPAGGQWND